MELVFVGVGVTLPVAVGVAVPVLVGVDVVVLVDVMVGGAGVLVGVGVGVIPSLGWNRIRPQPLVPIQTSPLGATVMTSISLVTKGELSGVQVIQSVPLVSLMPPTACPTRSSSSWPSRVRMSEKSMSMPPRDVPIQATPLWSTAMEETQPSPSNIRCCH